MAIRWRRYSPACKGKRTDGDRYGKIITKGIDCNGKRGTYCPENVPSPCGAWAIDYREQSGQWISKVFPSISKTEAKELLENIKVNIRRGMVGLPQTKKVLTVSEYCEKYLKHISVGTKENTYLSKERSVLAIKRHLGEYRLDKLTPFLMESFQANRLEKDGVSPATAGIDLSALRSILSMAVREGLLNKNPCDGIKGIRHFTKNEKRSLTLDEIHRLLDELEGRNRLMCLISLFTGLRLSDVLSLRWEHIDFNNGLLTRVTAKTERQEVIPISETLLSALRKYKATATGNCLFHAGKITHEIRIKNTNHFKYVFEKLGFKGTSFHTLRHSTATLLDALGNDLTVTSKILGHSSIHITAGSYIHRDLQSKRDAIGKLERHIMSNKHAISLPVISQAI